MKTAEQIKERINRYKERISELEEEGVPEETIDDIMSYSAQIRDLEWVLEEE